MERRNRDGKEKVNLGCPVVRPTWWDRVLEIVAGILAVVLMGLSLAIYLHSPGQIPIHFNYRGEADGWGDPALVFVFAGLGVVIMAICAAAAYHRQMVHMPIRLNPNCLSLQYSLMSRMCRILTLCMGGLFLGILSMMSPSSWHLAAVGDALRMLCMLLMLLVILVFSVWVFYVGRRCR